MKPIEIFELIKTENAKLVNKVPDRVGAKIVGAAFATIAKQIASAPDGKVKIKGLGTFRMKHVEREKDGQKVSRTRIGFKPAPAKAKAAKGDRQARTAARAARKAGKADSGKKAG